jgi:type III secretion protein J
MNTAFIVRRIGLGVVLALSLLVAACGSKVDLLASIAEADANEVIAALASAGITATKLAGKEGMVGIQVPAQEAARATDTLRQLGLPRENFTGMGQVFQKSGMISSPLEERARYLYALSQDLSATLTRIDGVVFARVHLVLPEKGSALEKDSPSSAAVFIKHRADHDLDMLQPQVRRMVVNSIPGLASERVSIVLIPSEVKRDNASQMQSVWGVDVPAASVGRLGALLWGMLALLLITLGGLGFLAWKQFGRRAAPAPETGAETGA